MADADKTADSLFPLDEETSMMQPVSSSLISSVPYELRSRRIPGVEGASLEKPKRHEFPKCSELDDPCSGDRREEDAGIKKIQESRGVKYFGGDSSRRLDFQDRRDPAVLMADMPELEQIPELRRDPVEAMMEKMRQMETRMAEMESQAVQNRQSSNSSAGSGPFIRVSAHPPSYDGTGDWKSFRLQFENCARLAGWSVDAMTQMLSCCLTKAAQRFYAEVPQRCRNDYDRIMFLMGERFGDGPPETYQVLLGSRVRKPKETPHGLKDELWRLVGKAYPGLTYHLQEQMTLQHFSRALDTDLRVHLLSRNVTSLSEAVSAVTSYEAVTAKSSAKEKKAGGDATHVYALKSVGNSHEKMNPDPSYSCYRCGKKGHIARNCKSAKDFRGKCYRCGKEGHFAKECPTRRAGLKCFKCDSPDHLANKCPQRNPENGSSPDQS
jgi:hypothetical protein